MFSMTIQRRKGAKQAISDIVDVLEATNQHIKIIRKLGDECINMSVTLDEFDRAYLMNEQGETIDNYKGASL